MRHLWVMRHAKAEREGSSDVERPLARRGAKDAPAMGRWLAGHGGAPDLIASSPAVRARQTAELVGRAAGFKGEPAIWDTLYPGDAAATLEALCKLDDRLQNVLLVTHNPHAEDLVGLLVGGTRLRMPTAALALLETETAWSDLSPSAMSLAALVSPGAL